MRLDLRGKDYKMVDGLFVMMDTLEVYGCSGELLGKLASASFPLSGPSILERLKSNKEEAPKPKKEAVKAPLPEAKPVPLSMETLKGPKEEPKETHHFIKPPKPKKKG